MSATPISTDNIDETKNNQSEQKEVKVIKKKSDESITNADKILKKFSFINSMRFNFLSKRSLKIMGFEKKDKHGIKINNQNSLSPLYGLKLVSSSCIDTFLNKSDIDSIMKKGGKYNFIIWALVKNGIYQGNYIFSYNKELLMEIGQRLGVELIKSHEMLNVLYSLTFDLNYSFNSKTNSLKQNISLDKKLTYTYVHDTFNKLINDAILENMENYDLYQGVEYTDLKNSIEESHEDDENGRPLLKKRTTKVSELLSLDFKGVVYTYFNFNKGAAQALLQSRINENKFLDGATANFLKVKQSAIRENSETPVIFNTVMMLEKSDKDEEEENSVYSQIGDYLGVRFKKYPETSTMRANIMRYSPLIKRNEMFSEILNKEDIIDYICMVHKDFSPEPQMFGTDHNGGFTNYNLKALTNKIKTTREHFFVGGETGSSKTTFINAMISQLIKFNWNTYKIDDMNGYKLRMFDVKNSLRPFSEFVKKHNEDSVQIMETNLNQFSYNLINCKVDKDGKTDKQDVSFCVQTTSLILEARDKDAGLTFAEKSKYEQLIESVYSGNKYETITVGSLKDYQEELANELLDLGYKPSTKLSALKEAKYNHLKKPTLNEVVSLLYSDYNNKDIQADETKFSVIKSLRTKLEAIIELGSYTSGTGKKIPGYYSRYEAFDLDSRLKWMLFDMDKIKANDEDYGPIQWILINRMIKQDMKDQLALRAKGLPEPKIIYLHEEAHNVFDSKIFKNNKFYDKAAREWRSYNIIIGNISQKSRHIPREVYEATETKFFLFAGAEALKKNNGEGKKTQIYGIKKGDSKEAGIKDLLGLNSKQVDLMFKVPMYTACAVTDSGTFTIKLHTTAKMRAIFDNKYKEEDLSS